jgi:hypothetical protein
MAEPFRILSRDDYDRLSTDEKSEYLRQAVKAQGFAVNQFRLYVQKLRAGTQTPETGKQRPESGNVNSEKAT